MKIYCADFNGVLTEFRNKHADKLTTPRDADVWVTWQDAQGSYADLFKTSKQLGLNKPLFCVQHGVAATRDYDKPNSFPLLADKYLCWGANDFDRLSRLGYGEKAEIVGCPLNPQIKARVPHKEKVILFVPVNTGKEEPENIAAYYELMKHKYHKAQMKVLSAKGPLKDKWGMNGKINVPFNALAEGCDIVAKLLPWHDKALYHGNTLVGYQDDPKNNETVFSLLRNVDLVVGLDEGTTEAFAFGHDVPVITVEGFQYRQYDGSGPRFAEHDIKRSGASQHCELKDLAYWVDYMLEHPEHLRKERAEVAERELGISYTNPTNNILKAVKNYVRTH